MYVKPCVQYVICFSLVSAFPVTMILGVSEKCNAPSECLTTSSVYCEAQLMFKIPKMRI